MLCLGDGEAVFGLSLAPKTGRTLLGEAKVVFWPEADAVDAFRASGGDGPLLRGSVSELRFWPVTAAPCLGAGADAAETVRESDFAVPFDSSATLAAFAASTAPSELVVRLRALIAARFFTPTPLPLCGVATV